MKPLSYYNVMNELAVRADVYLKAKSYHFIFRPALLNQLRYWLLHQTLKCFCGIVVTLMKLDRKDDSLSARLNPKDNSIRHFLS